MNRLALLALATSGLAAPACSPSQGVTDAGSLAPAAGTAFCQSVPAPVSCPFPGIPTCGTCVQAPLSAADDRLARTRCAALPAAIATACDSAAVPGAPSLACVTGADPAHPPVAPASRTVTVWGAVDVFDRGGDTANVSVQILEVAADGTPGAVVGQAVTNPNFFSELSAARTLAGFKIANVQTDHRYVVRTLGPADTFGHAVYDYTLIRGTDVDSVTVPPALLITGPSVYIHPRVLANQDWVDLPGQASLVDGIPPGRAMILGEVRDCDDVRLQHATVNASPAPDFAHPAYFGPGNDEHMVPDPAQALHGTGPSGGYALLSLAPGAVRVSAGGYAQDGAYTVVGTHAVATFADSVTFVTFRGLSPWQYQTP